MKIHPYLPQYREAVAELSLRAWAPVFDSLGRVLEPAVYRHFFPDWRDDQRRAVEAVCDSDDYPVWVALEADTIAGFVAVKLDARSRMGEIHMIAVDPAYQRRGIASGLTDFALARMKEAGMAVAMVETGGDPGHAPARAAYETRGFRLFPVARYFRAL